MIIEVKGDILQDSARALVNPVNTKGVMGKGLALEFKNKFKENYTQYRNACKRGEVQVGKVFVSFPRLDFGFMGTEEPNPVVVNFPTKDHYKGKSEYSYIREGLQDLRTVIIENEIDSIALPKLGCGLGGLEWSQVKSLIQDHLADLSLKDGRQVEVRVYV